MKKINYSVARKTFFIALLLSSFVYSSAQNNLGINTNTPHASAALDITSTTQGVLVPRMTAAQRTAIATPATGLLVYQTDGTAGFYFYSGAAWTLLGAGDNLGNHTATTNLSMAGNSITNALNITATGTATLGGNAYPTTTGTNGQALKTNGSGTLSWGTVGSVVALSAANTNAQAINSGTTPPFALADISFNSFAAPAIGSFDGTNYTVGAGQGGNYMIIVDLAGVPAAGIVGIYPTLFVNGTASVYGIGIQNGNVNSPIGRGLINTVLSLNAGDVVKVQAAINLASSTVNLTTNSSCRFSIIKL